MKPIHDSLTTKSTQKGAFNVSKHIVTVINPNWERKSAVCDGCQSSCQSACKTSCTVSNQPCPEK